MSETLLCEECIPDLLTFEWNLWKSHFDNAIVSETYFHPLIP